MEYSDEEIDRFVEDNRELIERLMSRTGSGGKCEAEGDDCRRARSRIEDDARCARERSDRARYRLEDDILRARSRLDSDRARIEDSFYEVYEAFTDPEVQKHFVTMGMNFMMGMSALMQRMPGPDIVKDTASGMESSWRKAACRSNSDCDVRKGRIEITEDEPAKATQIEIGGDE